MRKLTALIISILIILSANLSFATDVTFTDKTTCANPPNCSGTEVVTSSDINELKSAVNSKLDQANVDDTPTNGNTTHAASSNSVYDLQQTIAGLPNLDTNTQFLDGKTTTALTVGDTTPEVQAGHVYNCTGATTGTEITDFVDSNRNHTSFSDNDWIALWMDSANVTVIMYDNSSILSKSNANFAGSNSTPSLLLFFFDSTDNAWVCANLGPGETSPGTIAIDSVNAGAGTLRGSQAVFQDSNFNDPDNIDLNYNSNNGSLVVLNNSSGGQVVDLWDCKTSTIGSWVEIKTAVAQSAASEVYPFDDPTNDIISLKDGTALTAGHTAALPTTGHQLFQFQCIANNVWSVEQEDAAVMDGGAYGGSACSSTPPVGYTFEWNGEHASGDYYAAATSGDIQATSNGSPTISASYAYCGSYGLQLNANGQFLNFAAVDNTDIDGSQGTIWLEVHSPTAWTGTDTLVSSVTDTTHRLYANIHSNGSIYLVHEGSGTATGFATSSTIPNDQWNLIKISYSVAQGKIAVSINGGAYEEKSGTLSDFTTNGLKIGGTTMPDEIWIDNVAITSGFED